MPPEAERGTGRVRNILAATVLFGGLDEAALESVLGELDLVTLRGGHPLFKEGDRGDALYVVLGGRLRVERRRNKKTAVIREVARGEIVGELSLLTGLPRSAGVRAVRDTELARLSLERFDALLTDHPRTAIQLTRLLAQWLASSHSGEDGEPGVATVAVIPLSEAAPVRQVANSLATALTSLGETLHLTAERVDELLWPGAAQAFQEAKARQVLHWLDERERENAFVIYEGDEPGSVWSSRCLRHADRILSVARADAARLEDHLATRSGEWAAEDVVVVHPADARSPSGTSRWLVHGTTRHHHVRHGDIEDYTRLGRRLTGRGVGLVLGGGGARGFSHLGVLRALQELGIPIDQIGGTSMGAVVGAQYAAGFSLDRMIALNRRGWTRYKPHKAYTLPYVSIVNARQAERMFRMMFGDMRIEDFWIDFFAVSTNITQAAIEVHRRGAVVHALMASIAIPGVAPPIVSENRDLLVDGGVLNNLPATHLHRQADGLVIACDASPSVEMKADDAYATTPSAWRVLRDRLRPAGQRRRFPNIFEVLSRAAVVASARETRRVRQTADIYLHPPVEGYGIFAMDAIDELVEVGYTYAKPLLQQWWQERTSRGLRRRSTRVPV